MTIKVVLKTDPGVSWGEAILYEGQHYALFTHLVEVSKADPRRLYRQFGELLHKDAQCLILTSTGVESFPISLIDFNSQYKQIWLPLTWTLIVYTLLVKDKAIKARIENCGHNKMMIITTRTGDNIVSYREYIRVTLAGSYKPHM
jgi:hypothetical protein